MKHLAIWWGIAFSYDQQQNLILCQMLFDYFLIKCINQFSFELKYQWMYTVHIIAIQTVLKRNQSCIESYMYWKTCLFEWRCCASKPALYFVFIKLSSRFINIKKKLLNSIYSIIEHERYSYVKSLIWWYEILPLKTNQLWLSMTHLRILKYRILKYTKLAALLYVFDFLLEIEFGKANPKLEITYDILCSIQFGTACIYLKSTK